ncbi:MAG: SAM-dependent methyltransferase [Flavobacteriaceae bacterium]|nr:SAM-dependent methyltransferase [Flavobacteriaceae bacterium]|tara:strand:+ start:934 stop:1695 length:762 start_codon:yes stop_codon:yes gene_type:complete
MIKNSNIDLDNTYNHWFDSPYYHILYENRDNIEAKKFIKKILKYLQLAKGSKILDAACGKGRHSIEIEKLGYKVLGIDLSKNSIIKAKISENKNLKFLIHDISTPLNLEFDAVFNLFTSFGYYSKKKDQDILLAIEKNLKNGGIGVIDFFNINKVKKNLIKKEIVFKKNIKFKIKRKVYENYVKKSISFTDKNKQYNFNEKVNNLSLKNFKNYLSNTNLEILEFFGDYDLNPFDNIKSPRLIIILKKKSQSNK